MGMTLNPKSAYLSFDAVSAIGFRTHLIGSVHSGRVIPIASSNLFSLRFNSEWCVTRQNKPNYLPYSFNWADLNLYVLSRGVYRTCSRANQVLKSDSSQCLARTGTLLSVPRGSCSSGKGLQPTLGCSTRNKNPRSSLGNLRPSTYHA